MLVHVCVCVYVCPLPPSLPLSLSPTLSLSLSPPSSFSTPLTHVPRTPTRSQKRHGRACHAHTCCHGYFEALIAHCHRGRATRSIRAHALHRCVFRACLYTHIHSHKHTHTHTHTLVQVPWSARVPYLMHQLQFGQECVCVCGCGCASHICVCDIASAPNGVYLLVENVCASQVSGCHVWPRVCVCA